MEVEEAVPAAGLVCEEVPALVRAEELEAGVADLAAVEVVKPVFPLTPKESSRLPKELSSAIRDDPKSSSPNPFSLLLMEESEEVGVAVRGVVFW